jgi:mitochondrial fission protein ELM1
VLECHRAGDNAQSLGLAQALGWPFEVKHVAYRWYEFFPNMLAEATLLGIDRRRSSALTPPWPDVVMFAGRRNENIAKWIRRQSGGRTRIVLIGRNWTPPDRVDLVVTTPQFRLPEHPNVLQNEFPLHRISPRRLQEAGDAWAPRLAHLPRPRIAVLVGGSSGPYHFDASTAARLGREASSLARAAGGSLMVTTSARTRSAAVAALSAAIDVPAHFHAWRRGAEDNPYLGYLALADGFVVTADSLSMMAEACETGKPVKLFEFGGGPAAMRGPRSMEPGRRRWWRWSDLRRQHPLRLLYAFGVDMPAFRLNRTRDIRLVQDAAVRAGRAAWLGTSEDPAVRPLPLTDMDRAVQRVRALVADPGDVGMAGDNGVSTGRANP